MLMDKSLVLLVFILGTIQYALKVICENLRFFTGVCCSAGLITQAFLPKFYFATMLQ
jgi:hypothetical protein